MKNALVKAFAGACAVTAVANAVRANNVPNYSFENPTVDATFLPVSLTIDNWTTSGPAAEQVSFGGGPPMNSGVGIFPNTASGASHFTNADQNQLAYMFSGSTHTLSHVLGATYQPGQTYSLTVGLGNAGSPPPSGDKISIQLFYTTLANPSTPIVIANRDVVEGTDYLGQPTDHSQLYDFSATTGTGVTGAAVGRPIGLQFVTTGVGGGEFDLDNVRLSPDVPEPTTIGLLTTIAGGLLLRRRAAGR